LASSEVKRSKVLISRRWPAAVEAHLREHYDLTVDADDRPLDRNALCRAMTTFDAICPTVSDRIDAEIIATPNSTVRLLANYGVGVDHIDLNAARAAGIAVTNTPDVLTDATAELAILLMLMASRRASEGERELRSGQWHGWRPTHLMGQGLAGKHLGLVGFGRIARATAQRAQALGLRVSCHIRRLVAAEDAVALGITCYTSLEELVRDVDILSLHCPGGAATHHLVNAALLARMKPSAILINTARGTVVDETALAAALRANRIAAAGLDVYEREPKVTPALLDLPNVVLLPHLGSATVETRTAMGMRVATNLAHFFTGKEPPDRVA